MEKDTIYIELEVQAVLMEPDVHMQGDFSIHINGESLNSYDEIIDEHQLLESLKTNGIYNIITCTCGLPSCASRPKGISVQISDNEIKWEDLDKNKTWTFDKEFILNSVSEIKQEVKAYKEFFKSKNIQYVGVGYTW